MSYRTPTKSPFGKERRKNPDFSVDWYQHFPKDYLRPYGRSVIPEDVSDESINSKLQTFSCEWLTRPAVAVSEFAETLLRNRNTKPAVEDIMDPRAFQHFHAHLDSVINEVRPLWISPANPAGEATLTKEDVSARFERLESLMIQQKSSFLDRYIDIMADCGHAMYVTALHLKMMSFLMRNKDAWALKFRSHPDHEDFKKNPTPRSYAEIVYTGYMIKKGFNAAPIETPARRRISDFMLDEPSVPVGVQAPAPASASASVLISGAPQTSISVPVSVQEPAPFYPPSPSVPVRIRVPEMVRAPSTVSVQVTKGSRMAPGASPVSAQQLRSSSVVSADPLRLAHASPMIEVPVSFQSDIAAVRSVADAALEDENVPCSSGSVQSQRASVAVNKEKRSNPDKAGNPKKKKKKRRTQE